MFVKIPYQYDREVIFEKSNKPVLQKVNTFKEFKVKELDFRPEILCSLEEKNYNKVKKFDFYAGENHLITEISNFKEEFIFEDNTYILSNYFYNIFTKRFPYSYGKEYENKNVKEIKSSNQKFCESFFDNCDDFYFFNNELYVPTLPYLQLGNYYSNQFYMNLIFGEIQSSKFLPLKYYSLVEKSNKLNIKFYNEDHPLLKIKPYEIEKMIFPLFPSKENVEFNMCFSDDFSDYLLNLLSLKKNIDENFIHDEYNIVLVEKCWNDILTFFIKRINIPDIVEQNIKNLRKIYEVENKIQPTLKM